MAAIASGISSAWSEAEKGTSQCSVPSRSATNRANFCSERSGASGQTTLTVFTVPDETRAAAAAIAEESIPPERNTPIGASLRRCRPTELAKACLSSDGGQSLFS